MSATLNVMGYILLDIPIAQKYEPNAFEASTWSDGFLFQLYSVSTYLFCAKSDTLCTPSFSDLI